MPIGLWNVLVLWYLSRLIVLESLGGIAHGLCSIAAGLLTFWSDLRSHDADSRGGNLMSGTGRGDDEIVVRKQSGRVCSIERFVCRELESKRGSVCAFVFGPQHFEV